MDESDLESPVREAINAMADRSEQLRAAFSGATFVYGTQGSSVISKAIGHFVHGAEAKNVDAARLKNVFDPGFRARAYVHGINSQMMDLYYGQFGTTTYEQRNPLIGEFVHRAMRFAGDFSMQTPGYAAYWNTFGRVPHPKAGENWHPTAFYEGWETPPDGANSPRKKYGKFFYPNPDADETDAGMSATKYMSRVIRAGIMYFGGTLVYDGAEVYYESVFSMRGNVRDSDTAMEARCLLPFFADKRGSSKVNFGNGWVVFNWFGQEAVPTQRLFKENWFYTNGSTHRQENSLEAADAGRVMLEEFSKLFELFPKDHAGNPTREKRLGEAKQFSNAARDAREARLAAAGQLLQHASDDKVRAFVTRLKAKRH